jgi:hypothetical protein
MSAVTTHGVNQSLAATLKMDDVSWKNESSGQIRWIDTRRLYVTLESYE